MIRIEKMSLHQQENSRWHQVHDQSNLSNHPNHHHHVVIVKLWDGSVILDQKHLLRDDFLYQQLKHNMEQARNERLRILNEKLMLLQIGKYNRKLLKEACEENKKDREIVLRMVESDGLALKYANDVLRNCDEEIVMTSVKQNGQALKYTLLWTDEIIQAALHQDGNVLQHLEMDKYEIHDEDIKVAVKNDGSCLQHLYECPLDLDTIETASKTAPEIFELIPMPD